MSRFKLNTKNFYEPDLTRREAFWRRLHIIVNRCAWRFSHPESREVGHMFDSRWWRLNDWFAAKWIATWSARNPSLPWTSMPLPEVPKWRS